MKINKDIARRYTALVLLIREEFLSSVSLLDVRMYPHGSTAMKTKNGVSKLHRNYVYNSAENRYSFLYLEIERRALRRTRIKFFSEELPKNYD